MCGGWHAFHYVASIKLLSRFPFLPTLKPPRFPASSPRCSFAERAAYKPPPLCPPPRTPVPRAQAVQLGMQFAPILFQHPLNHSLLTDPAHWFEQVRAAGGDGIGGVCVAGWGLGGGSL